MAPSPSSSLAFRSEVNGVETVRELKENARYATLRMIMITARGQTRARAEALEAGVSLVVLKPFSPAELASSVQRLLPAHVAGPGA